MEILLQPWRHYFDFTGRSRRLEYGLFHLAFWIASAALVVLCMAFAAGGSTDPSVSMPSPAASAVAVLWSLFALAAVIPSLALAVRRLHDQNMSGWWLLLGVVPLLGIVIGLMMFFAGGTRGPNNFGDDPKDPLTAADLFA